MALEFKAQSKTFNIEIDMTDNINPEHYKTGGIETWDYLKAKLSPDSLKGFAIGNVLKYCSRAEHKNGLEDLKKARWYLNKIIENIESEKRKIFHDDIIANGKKVTIHESNI